MKSGCEATNESQTLPGVLLKEEVNRMTTRIENKQAAGEVETRKPIMLMNGKPKIGRAHV